MERRCWSSNQQDVKGDVEGLSTDVGLCLGARTEGSFPEEGIRKEVAQDEKEMESPGCFSWRRL